MTLLSLVKGWRAFQEAEEAAGQIALKDSAQIAVGPLATLVPLHVGNGLRVVTDAVLDYEVKSLVEAPVTAPIQSVSLLLPPKRLGWVPLRPSKRRLLRCENAPGASR